MDLIYVQLYKSNVKCTQREHSRKSVDLERMNEIYIIQIVTIEASYTCVFIQIAFLHTIEQIINLTWPTFVKENPRVSYIYTHIL